MNRQLARLKFAWGAALIYTVVVVLFGAVVRITGSGAGCGQHWPTCHGEITHLPQSVETLIELTHRITSGLSLLLVVGLTVFTFRVQPAGHGARRAAVWTCVFFVIESLVGAALVLLRFVGENDSVGRAVIMAVHLVNTCLLLGVMVLTKQAQLWPASQRFELFSRRLSWAWVGVITLLVISATGAVTALGDTLYPVSPDQSALIVVQSGADSGVHFLERVRGVHPLLALLGAGLLTWCALQLKKPSRWRAAVFWLLVIQLHAGMINVVLSAPGWMQVVHLALANALWLAWVLYVLEVAQERGSTVADGG